MVLTRQCRQVSSSVLPFLPLFLRAPVVQGKQRGGKELGIPTGEITLLDVQTMLEAGPHLVQESPDRKSIRSLIIIIDNIDEQE